MSTINFFKEAIEFLLAFIILWLTYKDTKRVFKAFFIHVERKILVIHSIKLVIFLMAAYGFRQFIPFHKTIIVFLSILLLMFLYTLTLKQVEIEVKGVKNPKYKAFKYRSKFAEYILYLLTVVMNFGEISKHKNEIKEKSKELMYIAMFPIQKYIAVSITHLEFTKRKEKFITDVQLKEIKLNLEPGDILLKRNDWQATNLGIPGFWTHSGLYIGSLKELDAYFSDVKTLNGEKFSEKLKQLNETIFSEMEENTDLTVIEAIEEGVVVKPLSNIAKVDYFSAVRPRLSKEDKLKAILKAFEFIGSPYDYYFNINSNDAFICTEVIKKAYGDNITLEMENVMGRQMIFPNSIAKKFWKERRRRKRELDFVLFYDLDIKTCGAYKSNENGFSKSWRRSVMFYRKSDLFKYLSTIIDTRHSSKNIDV